MELNVTLWCDQWNRQTFGETTEKKEKTQMAKRNENGKFIPDCYDLCLVVSPKPLAVMGSRPFEGSWV